MTEQNAASDRVTETPVMPGYDGGSEYVRESHGRVAEGDGTLAPDPSATDDWCCARSTSLSDGRCPMDFKRAPLEEVQAAVFKARLERAAEDLRG